MSSAADLYLDLLEDTLMGIRREQLVEVTPASRKARLTARLMRGRGLLPAARAGTWRSEIEEGRACPVGAETMIGRARMRNIRDCVETVIRDQIPGNLIEAGVWRGGSCIYMRAILAAYDEDREVWAADSFAGLPEPSHPADEELRWLHEEEVIKVREDEVRANFATYGLLDDRVHFVKGFFRDTLPGLDGQWAVIRLDGDMYESTMDSLQGLYPDLSPGGFLILDDYGAFDACRQAVDDYRRDHRITEPIEQIDWAGAFWRRS